MLFGTFEFYIFFTIVFSCWLFCPYHKRWIILLTASYVFYFFWKPWFCILLFVCTYGTWIVGIKIPWIKNKKRKRLWLVLAIAVNILPFLFFKYFNFFNNSLSAVLSSNGTHNPIPYLELLLPVGISFYSFQALSYCLDVYKGKIQPEIHFGHFALYLSFFPKLISGPIERGRDLLPQLQTGKPFSSKLFFAGVQLFFWGLFKKIVIADRLGMYVDMVYGHPQEYYGRTVILATWFFALQIYCDFSAYTDMAIGCGRIFGIKLSRNFYFPYFATSIVDFWKRWHITLTSWFRDYLYVPLGGNRRGDLRLSLNIMVVFLLSGLWHGAAWTFVFWGGLHGIFYLIGKATLSFRNKVKNIFGIKGTISTLIQVIFTFNLVSLTWVFFRAKSIEDAFIVIGNMFINFSLPIRMMSSQFSTFLAGGFALLFIIFEFLLYVNDKGKIIVWDEISPYIKYPIYTLGLLIISLLGLSSNEFIYFHF